jgi:hypothetical protein
VIATRLGVLQGGIAHAFYREVPDFIQFDVQVFLLKKLEHRNRF